MKNFQFVEEGLLPLEKLMDEEMVTVNGGYNPNDFNLACNCTCNCDVDNDC